MLIMDGNGDRILPSPSLLLNHFPNHQFVLEVDHNRFVSDRIVVQYLFDVRINDQKKNIFNILDTRMSLGFSCKENKLFS